MVVDAYWAGKRPRGQSRLKTDSAADRQGSPSGKQSVGTVLIGVRLQELLVPAMPAFDMVLEHFGKQHLPLSSSTESLRASIFRIPAALQNTVYNTRESSSPLKPISRNWKLHCQCPPFLADWRALLSSRLKMSVLRCAANACTQSDIVRFKFRPSSGDAQDPKLVRPLCTLKEISGERLAQVIRGPQTRDTTSKCGPPGGRRRRRPARYPHYSPQRSVASFVMPFTQY